MLDLETFVEQSLPYAGDIDPALYTTLAPWVQERVKRYDEVPQFIDWVVGAAPEPTEKDWRKVMAKDHVPQVLDLVIDRLETVDWTAEALTSTVLGVGEELDVKSQLPVRMAVTGRRSGLPLFEPMAEMDRAEVLRRLKDARGRL